MILHSAYEVAYPTWTTLSDADRAAFTTWLASNGIDYLRPVRRVEIHSARGQKIVRAFERELGDDASETKLEPVREVAVPAWPPVLGWIA